MGASGSQITPADLRVECMRCGGYGRIASGHVTVDLVSGKRENLNVMCPYCGSAKLLIPRKVLDLPRG